MSDPSALTDRQWVREFWTAMWSGGAARLYQMAFVVMWALPFGLVMLVVGRNRLSALALMAIGGATLVPVRAGLNYRMRRANRQLQLRRGAETAEQHLASAWALLPATEADLRPFNVLLDVENLHGAMEELERVALSHHAEAEFWTALSHAARQLDCREAELRYAARAAIPH
jgi:hypothetical protein